MTDAIADRAAKLILDEGLSLAKALELAQAQLEAEAPDPLALADRDVANLVLDMNAAVNRTRTADEASRVQQHLDGWRKALATVERAAAARATALQGAGQ